MGTGNKVYLNYGVAEGQKLKLIRIGLYAASVLMGTGNKFYLNYGVAEGQKLKLIRTGFYAES